MPEESEGGVETKQKRNELQGRRGQRCRKTGGRHHGSERNFGGGEPAYPDKHSEKPQNGTHREDAKRWRNYPRRCLNPNRESQEDRAIFWHRNRAGVASGKTGEGSTFSEELNDYSMFNKEKWLPAARDLPVMISHLCCYKLKKYPMHHYQSRNKYKPLLATMAEESRVRLQAWVRTGCNAYDAKDVKSTPMAFWTEQDVLKYIVQNGLDIASVYGEIVSTDQDGFHYPATPMTCEGCKLSCTGCKRTGCIFCGFGFHLEKNGETRFQRLARTHPKQYDYAMRGGRWADNPAYDPTAPKMDGDWQNWNPKKIWMPSDHGLGMRKVFEMMNELYGKDFYRYE